MVSVTLRPFNRLYKQVVIALLIVVFLAACGGDDDSAATPTVEATPAAGGMVMPTTAADAQAATPAPTVAPVWLIGDVVQALPDQQVRLYTDATTSAVVMGVYAPGTQFTVLDPSGDYALYPVENAGQLWYRLRAADGLVGWGAASQIGAAN